MVESGNILSATRTSLESSREPREDSREGRKLASFDLSDEYPYPYFSISLVTFRFSPCRLAGTIRHCNLDLCFFSSHFRSTTHLMYE